MLHLPGPTAKSALRTSKPKVFTELRGVANELLSFDIHDISTKVPTGTTRTGMNIYFYDTVS